MKAFSSIAAVLSLWLAVSFLLWLCYRIFRRSGGAKQRRLAAAASGLVEEGTAVFDELRTPASAGRAMSPGLTSGEPENILREDVTGLLNAIEAKSSYFDRVITAKKKIQKTFRLEEFEPLSEILQIRRDLWAASEIFLVDDIRALGPELSDAHAYDKFRTEACVRLFRNGETLSVSGAESHDPVDLRLSIAREEAAAFMRHVDEAVAAELEKSRFPTPAEIVAVPWALVKGIAFTLREARYLLSEAAANAERVGRALKFEGFRAAAEELRRARAELPGQFASAFERAGGLARMGGEGLKRHYEFVLEAQELRARYAEFLSLAPELTDRGKQFLRRLEIERHAEQLRESSSDALDWARQKLVVGIAYLIAGLQFLQAKIAPAKSKQLVVAAELKSAAPAEEAPPLRASLLPAAAYRTRASAINQAGAYASAASGNGRAKAPGSPTAAQPPPKSTTRLRDLVTGEATILDVDFGAESKRAPKEPKGPKRPAASTNGKADSSLSELAKDAGERLVPEVESPAGEKVVKLKTARSLLERLSNVDSDEALPRTVVAESEEAQKPKPKGWVSLLFKSRR